MNQIASALRRRSDACEGWCGSRLAPHHPERRSLRHVNQLLAILSSLIVVALTAAPAAATTDTTTQLAECPAVEGITCQGWVTDDAGVLEDRARLEEAVGRVVAETGSQIAVVITQTSGDLSPAELAAEIGNTWGVGDSERNDGVVVLVALDERRTEVDSGPGAGLTDDDASFAAGLGDSFFAAGRLRRRDLGHRGRHRAVPLHRQLPVGYDQRPRSATRGHGCTRHPVRIGSRRWRPLVPRRRGPRRGWCCCGRGSQQSGAGSSPAAPAPQDARGHRTVPTHPVWSRGSTPRVVLPAGARRCRVGRNRPGAGDTRAAVQRRRTGRRDFAPGPVGGRSGGGG